MEDNTAKLLEDLEFREGWMNSLSIVGATVSDRRIPMDDLPMIPKHMTYVQIIVRNGRPKGFFAACFECGADPFPDRQTLAEAEQDARDHGELRHAYSKGVLERVNQMIEEEV